MSTFLIALHIFTCIILVFVVLIQSGKEGGLGMMGGGAGSSQSVFGSSGGADFFTKFTSGAAAIFMITSIFLSVVKGGKRSSVFAAPSAPIPMNASPSATNAPAPAPQAATNAPAAPGAAATAPAQTTAPAPAPAPADTTEKK